jgi:hypothetical protein
VAPVGWPSGRLACRCTSSISGWRPTPTIQVNATRKIRRVLSEFSADSMALGEHPADSLAALAAFMATAAIVVAVFIKPAIELVPPTIPARRKNE